MLKISSILSKLNPANNLTLKKAFSQGHYPISSKALIEKPQVIVEVLNDSQLAMLNQLLFCSINYRTVYLSQERLGRRIGVGQRQARRILDTLDKLGLVRKVYRGFKKTCVYYVSKVLYKNYKVATSLYHYLPSLKTLLLWTSFVYSKNPFIKANVLRDNNIGRYLRNNNSLFVRGAGMRERILKRFENFLVLSEHEKIKLAGYPDEALNFAWDKYVNHNNRPSIHSPFDYIRKIARIYCEQCDLPFDDTLWSKVALNIVREEKTPETGRVEVKEQSAHHKVNEAPPISGYKNMASRDKERSNTASTATTRTERPGQKKELTREEKIQAVKESIARDYRDIDHLRNLIAKGDPHAPFTIKNTLQRLEWDKEELKNIESSKF